MNTCDIACKSLNTIDLTELIPCHEAIACLPQESAQRLNILPFALCSGEQVTTLQLVSGHSLDGTQRERIAKHVPAHYQLQFAVCAAQQLAAAINEHYRPRATLDRLLEMSRTVKQHDADNEYPVSELPVELVNALVSKAARMGASDIHLSAESTSLQVRLRVDGVLLNVAAVDKSLHNSVLVRIKIMASLDIAETRYPQDGHFRRIVNGHAIDFRVSTFPTVDGENTVLRLIDAQMQLNTLCALNISDSMNTTLAQLMRNPDGLIVVCGPTGSGKSTTLFALLDEIDKQQLSVMTLEDPVEHRVQGIRQTTIDASRHWGYAQGLRALLRQDPDVLLIGEVRDSESCAMALRAVSTGHKVLTTVHAACAHSALHRLRELNAGAGALSLGLSAIIAQRLLRRLCDHCKTAVKGCEHCHGTGYYGRQIIMEILVVTADLADRLATNEDINTLRAVSEKGEFSTLREQAMMLVDAGKTSIEEVRRVLGTHHTDASLNTQGGDEFDSNTGKSLAGKALQASS